MYVLRFVMLLSLVVWIGAIIFFVSVLAPTVFSVLPSHDLAGKVVSRSLGIMHWMGVVSGIVYLIASMLFSRLNAGLAQAFAPRHVLVVLMIVLTLISIYAIGARMEKLRADMGIIDNVPQNDTRRIEFNSLHHWSTRLEVSVLVLGLAVLYLTGKAIGH